MKNVIENKTKQIHVKANKRKTKNYKQLHVISINTYSM